MDLTILRTYVLRGLKKLPGIEATVDEIDDTINFVQETYIQPVWFRAGEAFDTTRGEETVSGEDNDLDATNKIYTADYKPFKRGSVTVYEDEEESEEDFTIDYENGTITFDEAQTGAITVDYTAHEVITLSDLASDIYKVDFIRCITDGLPGYPVKLVEADDTMYSQSAAIQSGEEKLWLRNIDGDEILKIAYWKKLTSLSASNSTPEIASKWHDLYWMGTLAQFDLNQMPMFLDRLKAFEIERRGFTNTRAFKIEMIW